MHNLVKVIFLSITLSFFLVNNIVSSDNEIKPDYSWVLNHLTIDPSTDLYYGFKLPGYKINERFVSNLRWNNDFTFFNYRLDKHHIQKNINNLPFFPIVVLPYGRASLTLGSTLHSSNFDLGTLFSHQDLHSKGAVITAAIGSNQADGMHIDLYSSYTRFLEDKLGIFGGFTFYTSGPQIAAYNGLNTTPSNQLVSFVNSILERVNIDYSTIFKTGFDTTIGISYRIPLFEIETFSLMELTYSHLSYSQNKSDITPLGINNFGINLIEHLRWNMIRQTETIREGNLLSGTFKFYLPTTIGTPNDQFRFKFSIDDRFSKKLYREFGIRGRLICNINYNISEDFSGEQYIRGISKNELTGWFALLASFEGFIPLIDVDLKAALDIKFKRLTKFVMHLALFVEGGFTIDNYSLLLENNYTRPARGTVNNSLNKNNPLGQTDIGYGNVLLPAFTAGAGIRIYPFFLHFILRIDVSVNILKAIVYQKPDEIIGLTISFSESF